MSVVGFSFLAEMVGVVLRQLGEARYFAVGSTYKCHPSALDHAVGLLKDGRCRVTC